MGASVPRNGEVVLSLRRFSAIGAIDPATGQVEVSAGDTLASLAESARRGGFRGGLEFAARESATIGGIAATDAGGIRACGMGTARSHIVGLEAILGDGTLTRRMSGLLKGNAGLAIPALLIGSEGTLGVITRVLWWAAAPASAHRGAGPLGLTADGDRPVGERAEPDAVAGGGRVPAAGRAGSGHSVSRLVVAGQEAAMYALIEVAGEGELLRELANVLPDDAIVADDTESRQRLWRFRERIQRRSPRLACRANLTSDYRPSSTWRVNRDLAKTTRRNLAGCRPNTVRPPRRWKRLCEPSRRACRR